LVYAESSDSLYAVNASTGAIVWTATPTGGTFPPLPVTGGLIYTGVDGIGPDPNVNAFTARTGHPAWRGLGTDLAIVGAPAVVDGALYIGALDSNVYALNASTGQTIWATPTGLQVESSPAVAYGAVYIGSDDGKLYA